jgi:hypothetical protein
MTRRTQQQADLDGRPISIAGKAQFGGEQLAENAI